MLVLHHAQPAVGVETRLVDHLQTELHRRVHQRDAGEGEQRAGVQPPGAGPVGLDRADHRPVGVAHGHALGTPGGPRGVEDVGQVLGVGAAPGRASGRRRRPRPTRARGRGWPCRGRSRPRTPASIRVTRRPAPDSRSLLQEVAVGHDGRGAASARACGPPRPGPGGGSSARPRRRHGGPPSTRPASAAPARAGDGCRSGRRARGPTRASGEPWRWPRRPTRRRSWTPTSTTSKAVRSPNSSAMRAR